MDISEESASGVYHNTVHLCLRLSAGQVLSLQFLLAADVLKSAISPTWIEIGWLAVITLIRTFLNYSLGHVLRHAPETNT